MKDVAQAVSKCIAAVLDTDEAKVSPLSKLADLGADSLDFIEIAMALEEELGVDLPDDELEKQMALTVGELIAYLQTKVM